MPWAGVDSDLSRFVAKETLQAINAYKARPDLVREHSNIEQAITQSGYGRKQLNELIQNAADAIDNPNGRIRVVLTADALYCANEGMPFSSSGYRTLMLSHSSEKRDDQIGRFGLGFKSVIQISDSPQIFSKNGSVKWDREHSDMLLEPLYPSLASYPVLRIATPIDPYAESRNDPTLQSLMEWASTVVKLPLAHQATWLGDAMRDFPHEFLLFSQNIGSLEFQNDLDGSFAAWSAIRDKNLVTLQSEGISEDWKIFRYSHKVSHMASIEAGAIAARETVEVTWAVPITGSARRQRGSFWNYFPTSHATSLRGIVNAAFKMNEDRHSMLQTMYNKELLQNALPTMVAGALASFQDESDPASYLDLLPARGRETISWADTVINEPIFTALSSVPCLPDRSGTLQHVSAITIQPELTDAEYLQELWSDWVEKDRPWLHSSALATKERRLVVRRLIDLANKGRASIEQWLEEITHGQQFGNFENALRLAVEIEKRHSDLQPAMRRSHIIPMQDGSVRPPIVTQTFLPMDEDDQGPNLVDYSFLHYGDVSALLHSLDFHVLDDRGKVARVARQVAKDYSDENATLSLWRLSRSLPVSEMLSLIEEQLEAGKIRIRAKDGTWRPSSNLWLSNGIIAGDSENDRALLVDDLFHRQDLALIRNLNVIANLSDPVTWVEDPTYKLWKKSESARISIESQSTPVPVSEGSLRFKPALTTPRLHLLSEASVRTREKSTQRVLSNEAYKTTVEFSSTYKEPLKIDGPDIWWVKKYGVLQTRLGLVEARYCVGELEGIPTGYLPYPGPSHAEKLNLPVAVDGVNWGFVLPLAEEKLPTARVHELYGLLAKFSVQRPKNLLVSGRNEGKSYYPTDIIKVAGDRATYDFLLKSTESAAIFIEDNDLRSEFVNRWRMKEVKIEFFSTFEQVTDEDGQVDTISNLFPFLHKVESKIRRSNRCVPCKVLRTVNSNSYVEEQEVEDHETYRDGTIFYYSNTLSSRRLLSALLRDVGSARKTADVESEMRRLARNTQVPVETDNPSNGRPEATPFVEPLKKHVSGFLPLRTDKDLGEQLILIERAVLRYLDNSMTDVFDLRINFEVDMSTGFPNGTIESVSENVRKLGGQARFED
ncbi:sacsin N-terminal ATP-binding-like domain-containing protein [Glutamicibacter sp. AGC46]